ncbi:unnamed protein product [Nyctereutes procyonoides]|uniref:(raccoon dog) hypothetical protein n=1 Tax=Nyctereutes procyonoides TaxID=34880 RepID=A0A811ZKV0_NYCPR|nr:unnamed protein product [Nyctereutes procyonoides]
MAKRKDPHCTEGEELRPPPPTARREISLSAWRRPGGLHPAPPPPRPRPRPAPETQLGDPGTCRLRGPRGAGREEGGRREGGKKGKKEGGREGGKTES